ncbi:MAG TPA: hypothetical protein VF408_00930 [Sediminibacterium sp.]
MPFSFYLIAAILFLALTFFFYVQTVKYMKKEVGLKNGKALFTSGAVRGILPVSLVVTVLVMLAVRAFFY